MSDEREFDKGREIVHSWTVRGRTIEELVDCRIVGPASTGDVGWYERRLPEEDFLEIHRIAPVVIDEMRKLVAKATLYDTMTGNDGCDKQPEDRTYQEPFRAEY